MAGLGAIRFLRGQYSQRKDSADKLLGGQPLYEVDTNKLYVGDGSKTLKDLVPVNTFYSRIITTQEEFEAWYKELDEGRNTGRSVLLVDKQFKRVDGKGIRLDSAYLEQVHGIGNASIHVDNFVYSDANKGAVWCNTTTYGPSISGLTVYCTARQRGEVAYAFHSCHNLTNCQGLAGDSDTGAGDAGYGFYNCSNLVNCSGCGLGDSRGYGFYSCDTCSNCLQSNLSGWRTSKTATWGGTNKNVDEATCPEFPAKYLHSITLDFYDIKSPRLREATMHVVSQRATPYTSLDLLVHGGETSRLLESAAPYAGEYGGNIPLMIYQTSSEEDTYHLLYVGESSGDISTTTLGPDPLPQVLDTVTKLTTSVSTQN